VGTEPTGTAAVSTKIELDEVLRICAKNHADSVIVVLKSDTLLSEAILGYMRGAAELEPPALERFELGWAMYLERFAPDGAFGMLLCPGMRKKGPIMTMGRADQAGDVVKFLSHRAHQISKAPLAAIRYELVFQAAVLAAVAESTETQGSA
jgi:hypothetical protein